MLLVAMVAGVGGCQGVAAILDKVTPDPVDPAAFTPAKQNLLILVESYQNPASIAVVAEHMDRLIAEDFITFKVAPVVNPDRLTNLRTGKPEEYRRLSIPQIGATLGAEQVVYADVSDFNIQSAVGTDALKAHADARVKVVNCKTGQTIWPRDATSAGFRVSADVPFVADAQNPDEPQVREALARALAQNIAVLFHPHTVGRNSDSPSYPEVGM